MKGHDTLFIIIIITNLSKKFFTVVLFKLVGFFCEFSSIDSYTVGFVIGRYSLKAVK